jgi:AraC-like DNA-binding protein
MSQLAHCKDNLHKKEMRNKAASRSTLDTRFRRVVDRRVHDEIQRQQLGVAQQLLDTTTLPVEEVAGRSGFSSVQYMYAVFRRLVGHRIDPSGLSVLRAYLAKLVTGLGYLAIASP